MIDGSPQPNSNDVATDVTEDSNWAYCSDFCQPSQRIKRYLQASRLYFNDCSHSDIFFLYLQETQLTVLSKKYCRDPVRRTH